MVDSLDDRAAVKPQPVWYLPVFLGSMLVVSRGWTSALGGAGIAGLDVSGLVIMGVAGYVSARWSGWRRPGVVASLVAVAGVIPLAYDPIQSWSIAVVAPAAIAVRPPRNAVYPLRVLLAPLAAAITSATLTSVVPDSLYLAIPAAVALLVMWLADRVSVTAFVEKRRIHRSAASWLGLAVAAPVLGGAVGFVVGIVAAFAAAVVYSGAGHDFGFVLMGIVLWSTVIGVVAGFAALPLFSASDTKVGAGQ